MNQETLTKEDLDILIEALDAWLKRDASREILGDIFGTMLLKDDEARNKFFAEREEKKQQKKSQQQNEQEIATLLKAKLILIKQKL